MSRRLSAFRAAASLLLLLSGTAHAAGITVTSPNGGESWQRGTNQTITWTYTGSIRSTAFIQLLNGGAFSSTITSFAPSGSGGSGSYNWAIPAALATGSAYQIRIVVFDATTGALASDTSDANFSVTSTPVNSITVTSPNGGESWRPGTTHSITWSYSGSPGAEVRFELLKGGALDSTIAASTALGSGGSGSFTWTIPANQANGSDYKVRVSSNSTSATDSSDGSFTLDNSYSLTVTKSGTGSGTVTSSPAGIDCGATCTANFAEGTPVTLTAAPNANHTFDGWTGDCSGTGACVVTLDAARSVGASFTGPPAGITVTTPNGGQVWAAGSTQTIRWSYTGNPGSMVRIELLKSGVLNRTISSGTSLGSAGSGSFNWLIPSTQTLGTDYRIRVTSTTNAAFTDTSDADFRINRTGIVVTSPNGGESWSTGASQTIRWIYSGSVGSMVRIELLKSGVLNRTVTSSTSIGSGGSGQFTWAVPASQAAGADYKIRVTSTATSLFTDSSDANFSISGTPVTVSVSPPSPTLLTGQQQQFTATVTGSLNQSVTWSVNGVNGGSAALGFITAGGLYTAPSTTPTPDPVTVTATSVADTSKSASASVQVNNPAPSLTSIAPTAVNAGSSNTTLTVNGAGFNPASVVKLGANSLATSYVNSGQLTAVAPAAQLATAGSLLVTVANPSPGGGTSGSASLQVQVVVSVSPPSATILTGAQQQFTSTIAGGGSVNWSVSGVAGGNATVGTVDGTGLYTAPAAPPSPNPITVTATSTLDSSRSGSASVQVNNPAPTLSNISPTQVDAGSGDTTLTVNGAGFNPVSVVKLGASSLTTTFVDSGQLTATIPAAQLVLAGTSAVTVVNPLPGGGTSGSSNLQIQFVMAVSPGSASPLTSSTQQFTATVKGATDTSVTWSIDGTGSGNSTVGTIDSAGLYAAPALVPAPAALTVRATSNADNTKSASAAVTVVSIVEDWPKYHRDLANTGRSLETILHSGNAATLKQKWSFTTQSFGGSARVSASPAVATVGGIRTLYVGTWAGYFYAIDAAAGTQRWRYEVPRTGVTRCTATSRCRIASSPAVEGGLVYFGAEDGYLYALNGSTGALVWRQQLGDAENGAEIWSSPAVWNGVVYVGLASHNSAPCVAGKMFAFDAATGNPVWTFDAVDQTSCASGTCLGAGIWSSPAIDEQFGTLWIGTGNAGAGCVPATAQATRYPDGILALSATSGTLKGFYQTMANDTIDSGDVGASPALHQTRVTDECGNTDVISYWVSVPSKDSKLWTAPRGNVGFLADPISLPLDGSQTLATPAAEPFTLTQSCAVNKRVTTSGNNLYQPTQGGNLYGVQQSATPNPGSPAINWTVLVRSCANNGCPLFSAPASTNDMVFFGGGEGNFYGYKNDGTKIYSFGTLGLVPGGPAISNGRIYFGSYDGNVYCLSLNGQ